MKIEIVKFKNGKYAVRRQSFMSFDYIDKNDGFVWGIRNVENYCQGTLEEIQKVYNSITDYGTPIKLVKKER